jgi:hypothetical protein
MRFEVELFVVVSPHHISWGNNTFACSEEPQWQRRKFNNIDTRAHIMDLFYMLNLLMLIIW